MSIALVGLSAGTGVTGVRVGLTVGPADGVTVDGGRVVILVPVGVGEGSTPLRMDVQEPSKADESNRSSSLHLIVTVMIEGPPQLVTPARPQR